MPRYLTPFVAIVVTTWLGGMASGFALVGGPEWATPTVAAPTITPSQGISGAVASPTPLPPGASGSTAPEATSPSPTAPLSPVAPSGTARTAIPTAKPTRAPSPRPTARPSSTSTLEPTVPPTLEPTFQPSIPPITPVPTLPPTLPPSVAVACGNGVDNSGGLGLICDVTVMPSRTTIRECHGAAGDPQAACSIRTIDGRVTSVSQCNGSANGGGSVLRCSVTVLGSDGPPATVNQCVGSGGGITVGCVPFPATAIGATVTQCNGSANGGTLVGLTCTASGSQGVSVDQCNGSGNGGGSLVVCSAILE